MPPTAGRTRKQGRGKCKGKGTTLSSRAGNERGAGAEGEEAGKRKRTIWSIGECVALAKAWVGVVEDPYIGANQHIVQWDILITCQCSGRSL